MTPSNIKKYFSGFLPRVIVVFVLIFASPAMAQGERGVLVAAESSQVEKITILEVRRIYLGLPSSEGNLIKKPVINLSSKDLYKSFLRNVMHMTEKGYRRKIVKRIFRQGGKQVKEIKDKNELVQYLKNNPFNVSFMSQDQANKTKGIKVIQVLW